MTYTTKTTGRSPTHLWACIDSPAGRRWYVVALSMFCRDGWAVMDDFGNLVEVSQ